MTSFNKKFTQIFTQPRKWFNYAMQVPQIAFLLLRIALRDVAGKKVEAKQCPPVAGGWRGGAAVAGLNKRETRNNYMRIPENAPLIQLA